MGKASEKLERFACACYDFPLSRQTQSVSSSAALFVLILLAESVAMMVLVVPMTTIELATLAAGTALIA